MLNVDQHVEEQAAAEWLIYEQPLSERVRTFLRLEFLLEQASHHSALSSVWDSRAAVSALLEITALLTRGDVRTEVLKELERCGALLHRLKGSPEVDNTRLQTVLSDLERLRVEMDGDDFSMDGHRCGGRWAAVVRLDGRHRRAGRGSGLGQAT